jgi:hypothetical protein
MTATEPGPFFAAVNPALLAPAGGCGTHAPLSFSHASSTRTGSAGWEPIEVRQSSPTTPAVAALLGRLQGLKDRARSGAWDATASQWASSGAAEAVPNRKNVRLGGSLRITCRRRREPVSRFSPLRTLAFLLTTSAFTPASGDVNGCSWYHLAAAVGDGARDG